MTTTITKELRQKSHQPSDEFKGFGEEENISEKMPILGSHKIKGFNNGKQGEINLEDFWHKYLVPPTQYGAKFSHIIGADVNELSTIKGFDSYNFLAAKLAYKIISYSFEFRKTI